MQEQQQPQRPAAYAEEALIRMILDGKYTPGSVLPGERELAASLGVTRPTVREALQRLSRDGWLTIQQGKSTRVNDIWRDGGLNILSALVQHSERLPDDFIPNLLAVRLDLAPAYARAAVANNPTAISGYLAHWTTLPDTPEAYAAFDWELHRTLTIASGNPIYTLILNGFSGFYEAMARYYFQLPQARAASRDFYATLYKAAVEGDWARAETITLTVIAASLQFWQQVSNQLAERVA